jgi:hypothetical protein
MKVERKQVYVAPAVESRRIALEGAAALSAGPMKVQVYDWESGDIVLGDDAAAEGGNIRLYQ